MKWDVRWVKCDEIGDGMYYLCNSMYDGMHDGVSSDGTV